MRFCIIIPVYNHEHAITAVMKQLKSKQVPVLLVNDGSSAKCSVVLKQVAEQENSWVTLIDRKHNGGKGAAVIDGFNLAIEKGFTHAIQVDADGQHQLDDIGRFIQCSEQNPEKMILGKPYFDQSVPKSRELGRQLTNCWVWINTLSLSIADGMCGFRSYPLSAIEPLLRSTRLGLRMDFDIDIAVRLYWQGLAAINIPTAVKYPVDGVSHFKMVQDNLLISRKHAQLFFGMLIRIPLLIKRWRK